MSYRRRASTSVSEISAKVQDLTEEAIGCLRGDQLAQAEEYTDKMKELEGGRGEAGHGGPDAGIVDDEAPSSGGAGRWSQD